MNKPNEAANSTSESVESLFNAATLGAAVVACAIIGPKVPPVQGD